MSKIAVFYGSTTGTCESLAGVISGKLGVSDVFSAADLGAASISEYDVLILGTSTWGDGELQDDWYEAVESLKAANLSGKRSPSSAAVIPHHTPIPSVAPWASSMRLARVPLSLARA